jgi:hypothetical protein
MDVSDQLHILLPLPPPPRGTGPRNPTNRRLDGRNTLVGNKLFTPATTLSIAQLSQYTNYCSSSYGPFTAFIELPENHYSHMVLIGHILKKNILYFTKVMSKFFSPRCPTQTQNSLLLIVNIFKTFCKSILKWYVGYGTCQTHIHDQHTINIIKLSYSITHYSFLNSQRYQIQSCPNRNSPCNGQLQMQEYALLFHQ